jgi:hypothetical protein
VKKTGQMLAVVILGSGSVNFVHEVCGSVKDAQAPDLDARMRRIGTQILGLPGCFGTIRTRL